MKKIITICAALVMTASVWAQTPQKMSYQAVIRNTSNALVTSTSVGMQISILQTTATGTAVYVERQFPTTNTNGLVSIEIGSGTVVSGAFNTIDWSAGPYFIKTETDLNGGANYTITGTSQLLSVPYALHAKTAESITGGLTETDPVFGTSIANGITAVDTANWNNHTVDTDTHIDSTGIAGLGYVAGGITSEIDPTFTSSQAANITATDITNLSNLSGVNTGDQTLIVSVTGDTLTISGGNSVLVPGISALNPLAIGSHYQGGIIAYILQPGNTGYDANTTHGIIAAPSDQNAGIQWYNGTYTTTGATGTAIGTGNANTIAIVANQGVGSYAAQLCADLVLGGYSDWYLPSKDELSQLYLNRTAIGGFTNAYYWSSTEFSSGSTWGSNFSNGNVGYFDKAYPYRVRAVRAF